MTSIMEIPEDSFDDEYREQQQHEKKEYNLLKSVMRNPKLANLFKALKSQFESSLNKLAVAKNSSGSYIMDNFTPLEILKMFNGLEIHYIQKAFNKLDNLSYEAFIILSLRILGVKIDEAPYALLGISNLFNSLVIKRNKKKLLFQDFLNSFLKIQSLSNENKIFVDDAISRPRFANSSSHDKFHHDNPIKNAFFSVSSQLMFCLDEVSDHLRIYDADANLIKKIFPDKTKHLHNGDVFIDFAWAENIKMIAAIYQDSRMGFFYENDKFTMEEVFVTKTLQYRIWYIPYCKYFVSCDTFNKLYLWNDKEKEQEELLTFPFKISDVSGVESFNVIAIATFDRKITLWELRQRMIFMVINLEDSSAHTIKYSYNQNLLFVSTFDKTVKIYAIDMAKDYTLRGKLEHPSSITAMELCDNENMVITCDDKANIKTWDTRSYRNVQSSKLQTSNHPNKIVHLSGSTRFCVLTNRLHFYSFTDNKTLKHAQIQTVPQLIFDPTNEEIYIATANDIRVFDMKYGVLSALYDHEMFNIKNKIVYLQRSKKQEKVIFADEFGEIKMLEYYTTYQKQEEMKNKSGIGVSKPKKFQPFEFENTNFFYDDRHDLLTTWRDNHLYIYRLEGGNQNTLIRSLSLPEDNIITGCKIFRSEWLIGMTINNSFIMFWEYKKMQLKGIFIIDPIVDETNFDEKIKKGARSKFMKALERKSSRRQSVLQTTTPKNSKPTLISSNSKSDVSKILDPNASPKKGEDHSFIKSDSINFSINPKSVFAVSSLKKDDAWLNLINAARGENSDQSETNTPRQEKDNKFFAIKDISDFVFIRASTAMIVLDEFSEVYLINQDRFESFKHKYKVKFENRSTSSTYEIIKMQVKTINITKLVTEKIIDPRSSEKLFGEYSKDDPVNYICLIADSEHKITIFNLKSTLASLGLATDIRDDTMVNPHYQAYITIDKTFYQNLFNKCKKQNFHYDNNDEVTIPSSKCIKWKAHSGTILNFKIINYNGLMLITMSEDNTLKIWTLEGVQLCGLFLNDLRRTMWNIQQDTDAKRIYTYERLKEKMSKIYSKFETDIEMGLKIKTVGLDDLTKKEENKTPEYVEDSIVNSKNRTEFTNFMAKHMLDRDKELLGIIENPYYLKPTVQTAKADYQPQYYQYQHEKKPAVLQAQLTPRSNYTTKLAQRLEDIVKKQPEKGPNQPTEYNIRSFRGSKFGPEISLNLKILTEKKADTSHIAKTSVKMPPINIPKTQDYQEYFKTAGTESSKLLNSELDSSITPGGLSTTSRFESTDRGKFRKNILVNLDNQRKLSKNSKSSVIHVLPKTTKMMHITSSEKTLIPPIDMSSTFDSKESYYTQQGGPKYLPSLDEVKKIGMQTIKSQTDDRMILDRATKRLEEIQNNSKRFKILDSLESKRFNLKDELKYMPEMDAEIENKLNSLQTMISHLQPTENLAELSKQIDELRKSRKKKIQKRLESVTYIPD